jgi:cytochrome oxidase Cu insertion factor (SCO1/SenC/PrrC family)
MSLRQLRFLVAMIAMFGAVMLPAPGRAAIAATDAFAAMRVEPVIPPRSAANLVLQATDGTPIQLADFKGKVVVVAFLLTN